MDKVTRQCPQTTTFLMRKESRSGIEPRSFRLPTERLTAGPNRPTPLMTVNTRYINFTRGMSPYFIVQELCESGGGRPELSVLTSLLASVDVKIY